MKISELKSLNTKIPSVGILLFIVIGVVPFAAALIYALLYSIGIIGVVNTGVTFKFWQAVIASGAFIKSFGYSFIIALFAVAISVGGALLTCLTFRRQLQQSVLSFMIYLPLAIPGIVTGFFIIQLFSKAGFFSRISYRLGFITKAADFPDLVNDSLAFGIVLSFITMIMPFFVLLFLNVYKNERIEQLSVLAQSLGATAKQVTRRVFLPIIIKKNLGADCTLFYLFTWRVRSTITAGSRVTPNVICFDFAGN